eukprot:COSAG01_NODE_8587_length_2728_cov_4.776721_2_plen_145_part_00
MRCLTVQLLASYSDQCKLSNTNESSRRKREGVFNGLPASLIVVSLCEFTSPHTRTVSSQHRSTPVATNAAEFKSLLCPRAICAIRPSMILAGACSCATLSAQLRVLLHRVRLRQHLLHHQCDAVLLHTCPDLPPQYFLTRTGAT